MCGTDVWNHCNRLLICLNSIFDELEQFNLAHIKINWVFTVLGIFDTILTYINRHIFWKDMLLLFYLHLGFPLQYKIGLRVGKAEFMQK